MTFDTTSTMGESLHLTSTSIEGIPIITLEATLPEGLMDLTPQAARVMAQHLLLLSDAAELDARCAVQ